MRRQRKFHPRWPRTERRVTLAGRMRESRAGRVGWRQIHPGERSRCLVEGSRASVAYRCTAPGPGPSSGRRRVWRRGSLLTSVVLPGGTATRCRGYCHSAGSRDHRRSCHRQTGLGPRGQTSGRQRIPGCESFICVCSHFDGSLGRLRGGRIEIANPALIILHL